MKRPHAARSALIVLVASASCTLAPVDIAQLSDDDAHADPTEGTQTIPWFDQDLRDGVVEVVELGAIDYEFTSRPATLAGDTLRDIEVELVPIEPPQLVTDLELQLYDHEGAPIDGWIQVGERVRFVGTLELGWRISLRADSEQRVELRAAFTDSP